MEGGWPLHLQGMPLLGLKTWAAVPTCCVLCGSGPLLALSGLSQVIGYAQVWPGWRVRARGPGDRHICVCSSPATRALRSATRRLSPWLPTPALGEACCVCRRLLSWPLGPLHPLGNPANVDDTLSHP